MRTTEEFLKIRSAALDNQKKELEIRLLKEELYRSKLKSRILMLTVGATLINVVIGVFKGR